MKLQLFCLPYAGGSASFYYNLTKYISPDIEVIPIEMKGHGYRIGEPLAHSMDELVNDVFNEIMTKKKDCPYAIMGYSMGSHVCYEVAHLLEKCVQKSPTHLFFCANTAPHIIDDEDALIYKKSDAEFIAYMQKYGGIPDEVLSEPEILEFFLPIMRADMEVEIGYVVSPEDITPFSCDCSVIFSRQDNDKYNIHEWREYTKGKCKFYEFEGNHFFIHKHFEDVARIINNAL